ncbi:MAG TPA: DoxX family protein [Bacteroidia bacterium]|jgi:hypothetical protein|nr:DoxX family protein [Bacteroidia bacterium]
MVKDVIAVFTGIFFSILFIQSSLDKVFNWSSELAFNKEHFAKSFMKPFVGLMFPLLTLMELSSGMLSACGLVFIFTQQTTRIAFYGSSICALTLIALFFGQRVAKDYGGAQSLVSYFILSMVGVYCTFC